MRGQLLLNPERAGRFDSWQRPLDAIVRCPSKPLRAIGHRACVARCAAASLSRVSRPSKADRGVLVLPGLGNNQKDYRPLAELLEKRGLAVEIASVSRADWLRNAAGLRDPNYWKGTLNPRPVVDWYLDRVDAGLKLLTDRLDDGRVALLAHSAGGWLARIYLLGYGHQGVIDKLVTLGSPHMPPPEGSKVMDQTRGILTHVETNCPGRFHEEVQYVSIAGRYIKGAKLREQGASLGQKIIGLGYQQVCGSADVWGDGVVPEPSAHLPGALQITLDDVHHTPVGSRDGTGGRSARLWYGSAPVLERWAHHLEEGAGSDGGVLQIEDIVKESVPAEAA